MADPPPCANSIPKTQKRNVLLIIADDLGLTLNCYGARNIRTPHLDYLAAQGTRFTNAYASTASCSGSRSTIYTGLHTHQNGQYGLMHGRNHFQTFEHVQTMPQRFNALGYQTGVIGKVHVGPRSVYPWEFYEENKTRDVRWNADQADIFFELAEQTSRPFHLTVAYRDPHRDDTRGGFGNDEENVLSAEFNVPNYSTEDVEIPSYLSNFLEVRKEFVEYYKAVTRMDVGVGLLMKKLKERGLDQNTLVLFVSDNGAPFLNSKTTLYDAGVRLPLIVRQPGAEAGVVNPNMVSFIDILPTCLSWAGQTTFDETGKNALLGHSFLRIISSRNALPATEWQQHVFGSHTFHEVHNYWPTRFLRTHKYKYHRNIAWRLDFPFATDLYGSLSWESIRNSEKPIRIGQRLLEKYLFRGPEELFDLELDPDELHNLVGEEHVQENLEKFRKLVERWQYLTDDPWLVRDGVSVLNSLGMQDAGLQFVDRFDFDHKNPGNRAEALYTRPAGIEKESIRSG
ncbi:alkaline-phosphatase-like protein [Phaeosphaeria sp. MPI-PUGE-AT-0046c]|nr:alkaline-phosphatase-like protein [Phaeosphaeria sp. MPI-PUGE-AT-0046c]